MITKEQILKKLVKELEAMDSKEIVALYANIFKNKCLYIPELQETYEYSIFCKRKKYKDSILIALADENGLEKAIKDIVELEFSAEDDEELKTKDNIYIIYRNEDENLYPEKSFYCDFETQEYIIETVKGY